MSYTSQIPPVVAAVQAAQAALPASGEINQGTAAFVTATNALIGAQVALANALNVATAALQPIMAGSATTPTPAGSTNAAQAVTNYLTALAVLTDMGTLGILGAYLDRAAVNLANAGA